MDHTRSFYNLRRRCSAAPPGMSSSPESGGVHVHPELSPVIETSSTSPQKLELVLKVRSSLVMGTDVVPTLSVSQDRLKTTNTVKQPYAPHRWGRSSPLKGAQPPSFRPMFIVATVAHLRYC